MRKIVVLFILSFLFGCAETAKTPSQPNIRNSLALDAVVLRVHVQKVEFTGLYPGCGEASDCIPFHFWHKYQAQVKEVISGAWSQSQVEFAYLQHGRYIEEVTDDCYIVIRPTGNDFKSDVGASYIADKLLSPFFENDKASIKALRRGA